VLSKATDNLAFMKLTRAQIVALILKLEEKNELKESTLGGINIWPFIRVKLFFFLIKTLQQETIKNNNTIRKIDKSIIVRKFLRSIKEWYRFNNLKKSKLLFVGHSLYRAKFNDISYNKFFDPLRTIQEFSHYPLIEYSTPIANSYKSDYTFSFLTLQELFKLNYVKETKKSLQFWADLESHLGQFSKELDVQISVGMFIKSIKKSWDKIHRTKSTWKRILNKVQPSRVVTLCYYTDAIYSLNLAAAELGIITQEMQHGPMSPMHLAYGMFDKLSNITDTPLLPQQFLVWNDHTKQQLSRSFPSKIIEVVGLPWFDFIEKNTSQINTIDKSILYALQPTVAFETFPDYLIKWIKQSSTVYKWYFRLHPRQFHEYDLIREKVKTLFPGIPIDIDYPTHTPLPIILTQVDMVFAMTSGVIIEASLLGKPVIALDQLALEYYREEYESKAMYFCHEKDKQLNWNEFIEEIESYFHTSQNTRVDSYQLFTDMHNKLGK
jgi:hypothetical protein